MQAPPSTASGSRGWGGLLRFGGLVVSCVGSSHTVSQYLESLVLKWVLELWLDRPLCHKVRVITASVPVCLSSCLLPAGTELVVGAGLGKTSVFPAVRGVKLLI